MKRPGVTPCTNALTGTTHRPALVRTVSTPRVAPNNWPFQFNGLTIRKGTVASCLANARTWTRVDAGADERALAQAHIADDIPALRALGLFEVLQIRDERLRALVEGL